MAKKKAPAKQENTHGGARDGSGLPRNPTKLMRVPLELVDEVEAMIEKVKIKIKKDWDKKYKKN